MSDEQIDIKSNYIVRLFRGDTPLVITYWVFGVLIGNGTITIAYALVESNYMVIASSTLGLWALLVFNLFLVVYGIFIFIAIWRSAGKYSGNSTWAASARVAVIFGAFYLIAAFVSVFQLSQNSDFMLEEEIRLINKSLPVFVNNVTRLDSAMVIGRDVIYNYTLIDESVDTLDIDRFNTIMMPIAKTNVCDDEDLTVLVNDNRKIVYMYSDRYSRAVSRIAVEKQDCL